MSKAGAVGSGAAGSGASGLGRAAGDQTSGLGRPAGDRTTDERTPLGRTAGGRLFVVATPIGNLGDVTFRAIETLKAVPLVAAEDTRLTRRLFARYGIETRLLSYHARSGHGREVELLEHLRSGQDLALVTDAGTPLVSDPGGELAAAWAGEGGDVVPIPGPSAVLAALVASGLAAPRFSFEGFLPRAGRERRERLTRIADDPRACVVYEAPGRVVATLRDLAGAAGGDRRAAVCRELTKLHEEVVRGPLRELADRASSGSLTLRGEFAIVVEAVTASTGTVRAAGRAPEPAAGPADVRSPGFAPDRTPGLAPDLAADLASGRADVERLVATGLKRAEAVRRVARETGLDRRELYRPG
jgi:16S rRNA (cytidine1402-2'-O)-methyltransferase